MLFFLVSHSCFLVFFKTKSHSVAQADLEFMMIFLPQGPKCQDSRDVSLSLEIVF